MNYWHTNNIEKIADMLREGWTARQIGAHFAVSRNAVIGVVHRNPVLREIGFKRSPGPQNIEKVRAISVAATRGKSVRGGTVSLNKIKAIQAPAIVELFDAVPDIPGRFGAPHVAGMDLMMLNEHRCKWPINDGGPFLFCGEAKKSDRPYCAFHNMAALGKGTESERSAVRSALKVAA